MPLFETFTDEQLRWLLERSEEVTAAAGERIIKVGDHADAMFVLLEGELAIYREADGAEKFQTASATPGVWAGGIPSSTPLYLITARTPRPSRLLRIRSEVVEQMLRTGFPIALHLLAGLASALPDVEALARQQERLSGLGKLAAGLAHELNNPAAAARRAAAQLTDALAEVASRSLAVGALGLDVAGLPAQVADRAAAAPVLDTVARGDAEDAVATWLEDHAVEQAWDLASVLVDAGLDTAWLDDLTGRVGPEHLEAAVRWLAANAAAAALAAEIASSADRISELVQAVKDYSAMGRAPLADVDVREGLESTLTMLAHELRGVEVTREYDDVPPVPGHRSELNQVWTNLIDNAADALDGSGHLRIRVWAEGETVKVAITDDGPGIPPELGDRVFQAFTTTKPVGQGTGLGLDIAQRIVTRTHSGDLSFTSRPGETTFTVCLPTTRTPAAPP